MEETLVNAENEKRDNRVLDISRNIGSQHVIKKMIFNQI
jgi:hypothetical protein